MKTLYIFIDESGNFDFSNKGTRHYLLCAVTAIEPLQSAQSLQSLKYDLLASRQDIECFHASPDTQLTRNLVFAEINKLTNIAVNYIHAEKRKTHPIYQSPEAFYALFGKTLLMYVFNSYTASQYDQIVVIFDKALTNKQQKSFLGVVKPELKQLGKPYMIYFHRTISDFNGQIADYCAWAKFISLEKQEMRALQQIHMISQTEFDMFNEARTHYY